MGVALARDAGGIEAAREKARGASAAVKVEL
jgi:formate-dependent phosphoribosylglycinamide formyltransferase (GAR transformylase)